MAKRKLVIRHNYALGDTILFTGLVRDIALTYPGRFEIEVNSHFRDVWANNPYAKLVNKDINSTLPVTPLEINYQEGIAAAGRGQKIHMLSWFHRDFARRTGVELHPLEAKGDLHLTPEELRPAVPGRYWVVIAGGKKDVTVKVWQAVHWQKTVDMLAEQGIRVVQTGALHKEHFHANLSGVIDMVGKCPTSRQFCSLIANADGVICPITAAMHIAACYDKPCVVVAGGREEPWWEGYTNAYAGAFGPKCKPVAVEHRYLHTVGLLDCCQTKGCWKHRAVALNDGQDWDAIEKRCKLPVVTSTGTAPQCLEMIGPDHVLEAVMSYYENGTIPPISAPKKTYAQSHGETAVRSEESKVVTPPRRLIPHIALPGLAAKIQKPVIQTLGPDELIEAQPEPARPAQPTPASHRPSSIEHPTVGGSFTVFVLCFGDNAKLAKACIDSIRRTLPGECLDMRVGLNAVCDETRNYVKALPFVTKIYDHPENAKKYPLMREMFWDPAHPIATPYLVWFDDDAKVVDVSTWSQLCTTIVANHPHGSRLYGNVFMHDVVRAKGNTDWFRGAPWYKGKNLRARGSNQEAPNGTVVQFVSGWFWALHTETMRAAGIPDGRLNHNGGDITVGEQVHQAGGLIKQFNKDKQQVWCPSKEQGGRRGFSEVFPWLR